VLILGSSEALFVSRVPTSGGGFAAIGGEICLISRTWQAAGVCGLSSEHPHVD